MISPPQFVHDMTVAEFCARDYYNQQVTPLLIRRGFRFSDQRRVGGFSGEHSYSDPD